MILEFALAALVSCDPRLTTLFAPIRPVVGRYQVCTTGEALDAAVAAEVRAGAHAAPADLADATAAFGAAGLANRTALVQLYAGRRARVVHAWRDAPARFESLTFVSPYPNAELTRLHEGTLIRTLVIDRSSASAAASTR